MRELCNSTFESSGAGQTCEGFVRKNPLAVTWFDTNFDKSRLIAVGNMHIDDLNLRSFARSAALFAAAFAILALTGCDNEPKKKSETEPVRAIKYMIVKERAGLQIRQLAGVVQANVVSQAAFQISGKIVELSIDVGDRVMRGQTLAKLDPEPVKLKIREAENALRQATANLENTRKKFEQQSALFAKKFTTKTNFDTAQANYKNAQASVEISKTKLESVQRDLRNLILRAPFDGIVAEKKVEVFEEVKAGAAVFVLQTGDRKKVEVSVPETLINEVAIGQKVTITIPTQNLRGIAGEIQKISPKAGDASAFAVTITMESNDEKLRAGMSARVMFAFKSDATGKAFRIPLTAVVPHRVSEDRSKPASPAKPRPAYVFAYDKSAGLVRRKTISVVGLINNEVAVTGALNSGDIIATAGVPFLHDGMKVSLLSANAFK